MTDNIRPFVRPNTVTTSVPDGAYNLFIAKGPAQSHRLGDGLTFEEIQEQVRERALETFKVMIATDLEMVFRQEILMGFRLLMDTLQFFNPGVDLRGAAYELQRMLHNVTMMKEAEDMEISITWMYIHTPFGGTVSMNVQHEGESAVHESLYFQGNHKVWPELSE